MSYCCCCTSNETYHTTSGLSRKYSVLLRSIFEVSVLHFSFLAYSIETRGSAYFSPPLHPSVACPAASVCSLKTRAGALLKQQGSILHVRKAHSGKCRPTKCSASCFSARGDLCYYSSGAPRFWIRTSQCCGTGHQRPSHRQRLNGDGRDEQQKT